MNAILTIGLTLALVTHPGRGVVIAPERLPTNVRLQLASEIEEARNAQPAAFSAVATIQNRMPELEAHKRGRYANVGPLLKTIGPSALLPMLELIAFDGPTRGDLSESAWTAFRSGLLEAVGVLRDPRAGPVLRAVLEGNEREFHVLRSAAEALGYLGDDSSAAKLVEIARTRGPKQEAVLAGMGSCRRLSVAEALASELATHPAAGSAEYVVKSLGEVGNAWAWKTPGASAKSEERAVRETAARALVAAFVSYGEPVRQAASNALMVVDDPSTPTLIQAAQQGASPDVAAALTALGARFQRNPTR
jgi:HEAT repeat protein